MIKMKIEELLDKRGKTFYWLAKETGINHAIVWKYRHGLNRGISFAALDKICRALKCRPGDVLAFSEGKKRLVENRKVGRPKKAVK